MSQKSPQLVFTDLEIDRLKIAFDMHSISAARESSDALAAGTTAGGEEKFVYVENLKDLLKTLFIVSRTQVKCIQTICQRKPNEC